MVLLSTAYLPPISYMALLVQQKNVQIEAHEHFVKQSYRNRCHIAGANGLQMLSVPVMRADWRKPISEIRVNYAEDWPTAHWRALQSAYNNSAFFEVLGADIKSVLQQKPATLLALNSAMLQLILDWLQVEDVEIALTKSYETEPDVKDYRQCLQPKLESIILEQPTYFQVFSQKIGFIPDCSIIDLIFSQGRASWDYLNELQLKF